MARLPPSGVVGISPMGFYTATSWVRASAHKRPISELEKWTETEAAAAGGSTAGPGRCTTWSAPNAGSRRRCPSSPMGRDPSTAKSASRSGARGGSRTGAKADGLRTTFRLRRPRAAGAILSFFDWRAGAPNVQIARPRSVPRGRDRGGSRRGRSGGGPPTSPGRRAPSDGGDRAVLAGPARRDGCQRLGGERVLDGRDATPWNELDDGADTNDGDTTCRQGSTNGNRGGVTLQKPSLTDAAAHADFPLLASPRR